MIFIIHLINNEQIINKNFLINLFNKHNHYLYIMMYYKYHLNYILNINLYNYHLNNPLNMSFLILFN